MPVAIIYSQKMADRIAGVMIKRMQKPSRLTDDLVWAMGHALRHVPKLDEMVSKKVKVARNAFKGKK